MTMLPSLIAVLASLSVLTNLAIGIDLSQSNDSGSRTNNWIDAAKESLPTPKTVRITWREVCFEPEGITLVHTGPGAPIVFTRNTSLSYELDKSAAFSGHHLRYSFNGKRPYGESGEMVSSEYTSAAREGMARSLHLKSKTVDYPSGFIFSGPSIDRDNLRLRPLLLAFFLSDAEREVLPRGNVTVGKEVGLVAGESCDIVRVSDGPLGGETHLYSSQRIPGLIHREVTYDRTGHLTRQIDLHFADSEDEATVRPALLGWEISLYETGGRLRSRVAAHVTNSELNGTIEEEEFDIVFPPGSVYTDTRQLMDDGRPINFIVNNDGTHRRILATELGRDFHEVVDTAPGEIWNRTTGINYQAWLLILVAGVVVACVLRYLRGWIGRIVAL